MASHLASMDNELRIWAREAEVAAGINDRRMNPLYLTEVELPAGLRAYNDFGAALKGAEAVIFAVPSRWTGEVAGAIREDLPRHAPILNLAKGFDYRTRRRLSVTIADETGRDADGVAVLSGPNHAEEVARRIPSATVIASTDRDLAKRLQEVLSSPYFRVYTNPDVTGVEVGGAYKNIIAVAAGILDGLGMGDNTKASLITRGLAEMVRFGSAMGANPITFSGLSGVGDLIVTCISGHSRNRGFGEKLGRGIPPGNALDSTHMVVEGVYATRAAMETAAELEVEIPIAGGVSAVLDGKARPAEVVEELMTRRLRAETEEDLYRDFLLGGGSAETDIP